MPSSLIESNVVLRVLGGVKKTTSDEFETYVQTSQLKWQFLKMGEYPSTVVRVFARIQERCQYNQFVG